MKNSYKKILIFQLAIALILILNSFVSNILSGYNAAIFLVLALIGFKFFFGFEKDRHRYTKDIIFEVIIFLLIFLMVYYLFGIVIGFAKTDNYYTLSGLNKFILPLVLTIILKEFLRYMMLTKTQENRKLIIITTLLFVFFDVSNALYYNGFKSNYDTFMFIALTLLPAISTNVVCSYISLTTGYKPILLYMLVIELYPYLIPIVPNPNEYIASIVDLILPVLLGYRVYLFFQREKDEDIDRNYKKKSFLPLVISALAVMVIVYFTSGYFKYYAIAIASGSMEPKIHKGDIVIIEKPEDNYDQLEVGQVIAYEYNGVIVVHRLINIVENDGNYYFYTQGDANTSPDQYAIKEDMIIGIVNMRIPYAGLPTVWLNEL